ncbi:MAG: polysaccharide deacetylase family protein [Acidobacteria bacterium]|nr:polysaccharide deacetylase family protein [Acidobacteriota bacterium]
MKCTRRRSPEAGFPLGRQDGMYPRHGCFNVYQYNSVGVLKNSPISAYSKIDRFQRIKNIAMRSAVYRAVSPWYSGMGSILMFHRVCPEELKSAIKGNSVLEITPQYLERIVLYFRKKGYRFLPLDEVPDALNGRLRGRHKFVVFTFDDGYRDNYLYAYPLLKKYHVPFTVYVTTSFPDQTAVPWWFMLDDLISKSDRICFIRDGEEFDLDCSSPYRKEETFYTIRQRILSAAGGSLDSLFRNLFEPHGIRLGDKMRDLALSWDQIVEMARDPLVTIGSHTRNHTALNRLGMRDLVREIVEPREALEARIGLKVRHFCYPFGSKYEAGPREFNAVREVGFRTATTTRLSNLFAGHRRHLLALPRIWVDGNVEDTRDLDLLVTGFMPLLLNRFKRVVAD